MDTEIDRQEFVGVCCRFILFVTYFGWRPVGCKKSRLAVFKVIFGREARSYTMANNFHLIRHTHPYMADRTLPKPHFKFAHFHCRWLCDVHLFIVVKFGLEPSTTGCTYTTNKQNRLLNTCSSYYRDFSDRRTFGMHCNIGYFSFRSVFILIVNY